MTIEEAKDAFRAVISNWADTFSAALAGLHRRQVQSNVNVSSLQVQVRELKAKVDRLEEIVAASARQPNHWLQ